MKGAVFHRYGNAEVLELVDLPEPTPGENDVLVAVRAASLNPLDWHFMTGLPYVARLQMGLTRPRAQRVGADLAGVVAAVGKNVSRFAPGDEVFGGYAGETAEHPSIELGTCAERVCVPENALVPKPGNLTFEQAAAVSVAGQTALQGLRDLGCIHSNQRVLINGASGGVGTFAVQLARWFGATVTGVCGQRNVERVRSIGADVVVDYTREDFTLGESRYDLVFDGVGNRSLGDVRRILAPNATYVACFGQPENLWFGPLPSLASMWLRSVSGTRRWVTWETKLNLPDHELLARLLEEGAVIPIVDRVYPLPDIREAMAKLATGHARGKIVVSMPGS